MKIQAAVYEGSPPNMLIIMTLVKTPKGYLRWAEVGKDKIHSRVNLTDAQNLAKKLCLPLLIKNPATKSYRFLKREYARALTKLEDYPNAN